MLANVQDHPFIPVAVLVLFIALFISLIFMIYRKDTNQMYDEASQMPLNDKGAQNE